MFLTTFWFELSLRLRSKSTYICIAIIAIFSSLNIYSSYWDELLGSGRVVRNCPFVVYYLMMIDTFWVIIIGAGLMTAPIYRDLQLRVAPILYASPVRDRGYFLGKYCSSMLGLLLVSSGMVLALIAAPWMGPGLGLASASLFMPTPWQHLIHAYLVFVLPGCFFMGTMYFCLTAWTGRVTPAYVLATLVFLSWLFIDMVFKDQVKDIPWVMVLDPLAFTALEDQVLYWSAEERMTKFLDFSGPMLWNRLTYVLAGIAALITSIPSLNLRRLLHATTKSVQTQSQELASPQQSASLSPVSINLGNAYWLSLTLRSAWREFKACFHEIYFQIFLVVCVTMVFLAMWRVGPAYYRPEGTLLPVPLDILGMATKYFLISAIVAVIFYAGEILHRERVEGVSSLVNSTPMPTWSLVLSKYLAIGLLSLGLALMPAVVYFATQFAKGFVRDDLGILMLVSFTVILPCLLEFASIAILSHVLANQRFFGHFLAFSAYFSILVAHELKMIEHRLWQYGIPSEWVLSDFNGLSPFLSQILWLNTCFLAMGGCLLILAFLIWQRGSESDFAARFQTAQARLSIGVIASLGICLAIGLGAGGNVYYQISILHGFQPHHEEVAEAALYEQKYRQFAQMPQPKIRDADLKIAIEPQSRTALAEGTFTLRNPASQPIEELHLEPCKHSRILSLQWNDQPLRAIQRDDEFRYHIYELPDTLLPEASATLKVEVRLEYRGLPNDGYFGTIVSNGTVLDVSLFPSFGYNRDREAKLIGDRNRFGLPAREALPPPGAANEVSNLYVSDDADLVDYRVTLITPRNQIGLAPGMMLSQTEHNGQNKTTYRGRLPGLWNLYFVSGEYQVSERQVPLGNLDSQPIQVEMYHHPRHTYNIEHMLKSTELALKRYHQLLGRPLFETLQIVEVPNQITPTLAAENLILLPEDQAWVHDYRDGLQGNWAQYVIAREIAKQWFGRLLAAKRVQGHQLINEILPSYLALIVLGETIPPNEMQRLLKHLNDEYQLSSAMEDGIEPALLFCDEEAYVVPKGSLLLYGLRGLIGPENLDPALRKYLQQFPDPSLLHAVSSLEIYELFKKATPPKFRASLNDAFKNVVIYSNSVVSASAQPVTTGYEVSLEIQGVKYQATKRDNRTAVSMDDFLEIGIFVEGDKTFPSLTELHRIRDGTNHVTIKVPRKPERVAIDPFSRYLDRNLRDNALPVSVKYSSP